MFLHSPGIREGCHCPSRRRVPDPKEEIRASVRYTEQQDGGVSHAQETENSCSVVQVQGRAGIFTSNNVAETARKYGIHANQLSTWRSYFLEQGPSIFQTDVTKREQELEKQIATLEQLLGKKELEIQLVKNTWIFTPRALATRGVTRERW